MREIVTGDEVTLRAGDAGTGPAVVLVGASTDEEWAHGLYGLAEL